MSNTKIYIQYKEPQHKKWHFASCVVEERVATVEEAEKLLDWGSTYNKFISDLVYYSERNCLENWKIFSICETDAAVTNSVNLTDVPEEILESEKHEKHIKKLERETKSLLKQAEVSKKSTELIQKQIDLLSKENIALLINDWKLTEEEAVWADANWKVVEEYKKKSVFKLCPSTLKRLYAEAHNTTPTVTPEVFAPIKDIEENGEFIKVLDTLVPVQLFIDYVTHLGSIGKVKDWEFGEFEAKRVILHSRLFEALGADRIHRSEGRGREVYSAIEDVIRSVTKCTCGGALTGYGKCSDCGKTITSRDYVFHLRELIVSK